MNALRRGGRRAWGGCGGRAHNSLSSEYRLRWPVPGGYSVRKPGTMYSSLTTWKRDTAENELPFAGGPILALRAVGAWRNSVDKISVIIPAYNEEAYVVSDCIRETLRALDGSACEVIVVDDGSKDGTRSAALSVAAGNGCVKVVGYEINQGKGYALKPGFAPALGALKRWKISSKYAEEQDGEEHH